MCPNSTYRASVLVASDARRQVLGNAGYRQSVGTCRRVSANCCSRNSTPAGRWSSSTASRQLRRSDAIATCAKQLTTSPATARLRSVLVTSLPEVAERVLDQLRSVCGRWSASPGAGRRASGGRCQQAAWPTSVVAVGAQAVKTDADGTFAIGSLDRSAADGDRGRASRVI